METEYLEHVVNMLTSIEDKVERSFSNLTDEQINWKPNKKSWSIGGCLDHLVLSNSMYFSVLEKVKHRNQKSSFWKKLPGWNSMWGKILINSVDPIKNKKSKTTKDLDTKDGIYNQQIVQDFISTQAQLKVLAHELDGYDHKKIVVAFPTIKSITMKLDVAFKVLWMHEQKHYNQAVRIMENPQFPASIVANEEK